MKCINCGNELPDNASFCGNCGRKLYQGNSQQNNNTKKQTNGKHATVIIALLAVIMALLAGIFGYIFYDSTRKTTGNENDITPSVTVAPMPTPTPEPTPIPTENVAKLETYYVVNCNDHIALREFPNNSSNTIKTIPLGEPVSYVESSQNGFAKVIYNGTTGYALQSYLSSNIADVRKPNTNNTNTNNNSNNNNNTNSTNQTTSNSVVSNPSYITYNDSEFSFSCAYPAHFQEYYESDNFVRYSLKAPDNTARLKICATNNKANLSVQTVLSNFKSSYPGTVDYQNSGDTWCAASTLENGWCHYGYFKIVDGMIRGFELHYDRKYEAIYDGYVNDIYNRISFN